MLHNHHEEGVSNRSRISTWVVIGVIVLIILLLIWITVAEATGDTDVSAPTSMVLDILPIG